MTKILITGGAGFIGTSLAERLLRDGHCVHIIDDLSTGTIGNIKRLAGFERFRFSKADITQPGALKSWGQWGLHDKQIYNLACPASPVAYGARPLAALRTCFVGTEAVLRLAEASGARILHASTSEVYGDPLEHPQTEGYWGHVNPVGPRSCYDEGKRVAETLCYEYGKAGLSVRVARIFNTYGPFMQADDGRVVSNFITQALAGRPLTVYGDGSQTRSLCYVDDTVEGLIRLMNSPVDVPVNIGNPFEVDMGYLAKLILRLCRAEGGVAGIGGMVGAPLPPDDPRQRCPDISRAKLALDWEPKTSLEAGLLRTIAHFKEVQNAAAA